MDVPEVPFIGGYRPDTKHMSKGKSGPQALLRQTVLSVERVWALIPALVFLCWLCVLSQFRKRALHRCPRCQWSVCLLFHSQPPKVRSIGHFTAQAPALEGFEFWNSQVKSTLPHTIGSLLTPPASLLIHPVDAASVFSQYRRCARSDQLL